MQIETTNRKLIDMYKALNALLTYRLDMLIILLIMQLIQELEVKVLPLKATDKILGDRYIETDEAGNPIIQDIAHDGSLQYKLKQELASVYYAERQKLMDVETAVEIELPLKASMFLGMPLIGTPMQSLGPLLVVDVSVSKLIAEREKARKEAEGKE